MASTIMLIRHGEKPVEGQSGVRVDGSTSDHSLIVKGWQRAGALANLFATASQQAVAAALPIPQALVAASPTAPSADPNAQSRREEETVMPLANRLNVPPNLSFGKGEEHKVAALARAASEPMLIVWEHENIPRLAGMIAPTATIPAKWPAARFDLTWVFRPGQDGEYAFQQLPQLLLSGDSATTITN